MRRVASANITARRRRFFTVAFGFLAFAPLAWCQRYPDWRSYTASDGLAESACVSVSVASNGKVIAKHLNVDSISELNGYSVTTFPSPEPGRNRVYEDADNRLWTITSAGLEEYREGAWNLHPIPEVAEQFHGMIATAVPPIPLEVVKQGRLLILLPEKLMEFDPDAPAKLPTQTLRTAGQTGLQKFLGFAITGDGSLWISGQSGLAFAPGPAQNLGPDSQWKDYPAPASLHATNFVQPIADIQGSGVTCVADSSSSEQKLIVHFDGQEWTAQPAGTDRVRGAWREPDGITWVVTYNGLFQIDHSGSPGAEMEEVTASRYFDVAVQTNGTFWIASAEGLLRYSPPLWKSPDALQRLSSAVTCLAEDPDSRLWFVSAGALHSFDGTEYREHALKFRRTLQNTRALFPLQNGGLLLDTGEELFQFQPATDTLNPLASPRNDKRHALGLFRDGSVAVQTIDASGQQCRLEKYDGDTFHPMPQPPSERDFSTLLETQNGDLWLGGEHGPAWYHEKRWQTFSNLTSGAVIVSIAETMDGKVWCASGNTIWEFNGQAWAVIHSIDQINNMIRARDGSVWIAANSGLFRYIHGAWVENSVEEGLPNATARQVYEDQEGRLWTGTARGLALFHPELDTDPPRTHIHRQPDEDTVPQSADLTIVFTGTDKWKYTPRGRLLYSFRLDQHDWSEFTEENAIVYRDRELAPGPHSFDVRAMDRNGNVETRPPRLTFSVALPWYEETRLVFTSLAGVLAVLFFAGLAFNRHRKLVRSYAEIEKKVAERTRELELTSRELVHSQKMNALGTLAAGIAHDFNNILSIIKGSAQIIEDNLDNAEKVRTRADRIKTVVEQGSGIVKAMLGFSAGSGGEAVPCDINAVVSDTIQLLGDRFQRETAVIFRPEEDLPQTQAVREFVQQILLNFVFNAAEAEAAARRKQILLGTHKAQQLPESLALAPASGREYIMISVQDFGCGIPSENLSRIFEPFFTTKALSARRGTGLGLSMVYELARKMEAGLNVESTVNVGSTFTLILPVKT